MFRWVFALLCFPALVACTAATMTRPGGYDYREQSICWQPDEGLGAEDEFACKRAIADEARRYNIHVKSACPGDFTIELRSGGIASAVVGNLAFDVMGAAWPAEGRAWVRCNTTTVGQVLTGGPPEAAVHEWYHLMGCSTQEGLVHAWVWHRDDPVQCHERVVDWDG